MGFNRYTYVGAYIEAPVKMISVQETFYSCSNGECKNHKKRLTSNYCPICGKGVQEISFINKGDRRLRWLIDNEEIGIEIDVFFVIETDEADYLTSNYTDCGALVCCEEMMAEISSKLIREKILEFRQKHGVDLEKVRDYYGLDLPVKFGVIEYYM